MNLLTSQAPKLILASGSPRREDLLRHMGVSFEKKIPAIPEIQKSHEPPDEFAKRLSREKALHVTRTEPRAIPTFFLGADTIVVFNNHVLGKPKNEKEACLFLKTLSGNTHTVMTGFCLANEKEDIIVNDIVSSQVTMKHMNASQIKQYIETGEPMDKAGAYAAQGLGREFIEKIEGSEHNVIGLPTEALRPWLQQLGLMA